VSAPLTVDRRGLWAPLASRPFRLLVAARVVDVLGNAVAPVALAFAVLDLTGSATDLGLVVGARSVTNVVLLLFGGVLADRVSRHVLLVGSSLAAAVTQGVVAALVLTRTDSIGLLAAMSALNGAVSAFAFPAAAALQPQTVPRAHLQQAAALAQMGVSAAGVLGASLGGVLVAAVGPGWGIAADAVSFLLAAALFARIHLTARATTTGQATVWRELATGWAEFRSRTWLWAVVTAFLLINAVLAGGTGVLGPLVADRSFGRATWGLILAVHAAGTIVGGVIALRLRIHHLLLYGMACVAAEALFTLALGLTPPVGIIATAALLGGLGVQQFDIAWNTSVQQHVPADRLARVYSWDMLGSFVAIPLGQTLAGPLAAAVGTRPTLVSGSILIVLATAGALLPASVRQLRNTALDVAPSADAG